MVVVPNVREGALCYALAAANALLVFYDFTIHHSAATFPLRLMFGLGCAALPFLTALILAHLFAKSDLDMSTKGVTPAFQANLEIFWILSLVIATLVEAASMHQA
jgi:hypothetical protein